MPLPLCPLLLLLLLLLPGAATPLPLEGSIAGHDGDSVQPMQEVAAVEESSLLTLPAPRTRWVSRAAPSVGEAARRASKRQEGPAAQQAPRPEKAPCRGFFWKTFSSCK